MLTHKLFGPALVEPVLGAALCLLLLSTASAQRVLDELLHRENLPPSLTGRLAAVDLDGDGDSDFIIQSLTASSAYLNDGHARFSLMASPPPFGPKILRGDFDGDQLEDVIDYDNLQGNISAVYLRRPSASWQKIPFLTAMPLASFHLADFDGDGDIDAIGAGRDPVSKQLTYALLINDGRGNMSDQGAQRITGPGAADAFPVDIDGDGDLDFLAGPGPSGGLVRTVFTNDGTGKFTAGASLPWDVQDKADLDGDGIEDLLVVRALASGGYTLDVWHGATRKLVTGSGWPTNMAQPSLLSGSRCYDFDSDGDQDILLAQSRSSRILENLGQLQFQERSLPGIPLVLPYMLVFDVDGDSDLDIMAASGLSVLLLNDSKGKFTDIMNRPTVGSAVGARGFGHIIDLDGDDDLDIVYALGPQPSEQVLINDGTGHFAGFPFAPGSVTLINPLAFGDVDGDGDADALLSDNGIWLRLNQGNSFPGPGIAIPNLYGRPYFVDLDLDGDLDILSSVSQTGKWDGGLIFKNTPTGFVDQGRWRLGAASNQRIVAIGDIDADGDTDLICSASLTQWDIYTNNGAAVFSPSGSMTWISPAYRTASSLGDLDTDGDLDILIVDGKTAEMWANDGKGAFTLSSSFPLIGSVRGPALIDVDGDGDLDMIDEFSRTTQVRLNNGSGIFQPPNPNLTPRAMTLIAPAVGDMDGDGDTDLINTFSYGGPRIISNLTRHLSATSALLSGADFAFDVHAHAQQTVTALPLVAFGELASPVHLPSLGKFWLDPALTFALQPLTIGPSGVAESQRIPIPSAASLLGVVISAQAVIMPSTSVQTWRLTNLVREQIQL